MILAVSNAFANQFGGSSNATRKNVRSTAGSHVPTAARDQKSPREEARILKDRLAVLNTFKEDGPVAVVVLSYLELEYWVLAVPFMDNGLRDRGTIGPRWLGEQCSQF